MSALSVGSTAFVDEAVKQRSARVAAALDERDTTKRAEITEAIAPSREDALTTIVKWVPGEVIGAYSAVIAALVATSSNEPGQATGAEGALVIAFMIGALLVTVFGGYNSFRRVTATGKMPTNKRIELFVRGVLSALGLLLWSCVIPGTATNRSDLLSNYQGAASAAVFFVAIVFGLFAEFMILPATIGGIKKILSGR